MQVQLPGTLSSLTKKVLHKKEATKPTVTTQPKDGKTLSFMSIPSVAFMGKLVVPTLPKGTDIIAQPKIEMYDSKKYEGANEPVVKYKAYPQDPLVTPKPEFYSLKGSVMPGPESDRVKINHMSSENAKPNEAGNFDPDVESPQFDRVNVFMFTQKVLNMYEKVLGRKINWAFRNEQLKSNPLAGVTMNAYYSRNEQTTKFFYFNSRTNPTEKCYTSKMADVVTHETGHATLDGLKPGYLGWGHHGGAIHEGWSDATASLVALDNDTVLDDVIEKTGGDLRKENLVASLAEQFGKAVYGNKLYLRNAINDLTLTDFMTGKESREVHNFGRLLAGTNYDIIVEMTYQNMDKGKTLRESLIKAKEDMTVLMARALGDFAPAGNIMYPDVAKAYLKSEDHLFGGEYKDMIKNVILKRELLKPDEIKAWEAEQANLPKITLPPKTMESTQSIIEFVNEHKGDLKAPAENNYKLESAYSNKFGETFIHVVAPRPVELPPQDPDNPRPQPRYRLNIYDGLTLGFDKTGKLFYKAENETKKYEMADAIEDAQETLAKMKATQTIGLNVQPKAFVTDDGTNTLIKNPILEDPVN